MAYRHNKAWRNRNRSMWNEVKKRNYARGGRQGLYKPWTPDEDRLVLGHDIPDRRLASKLGRSVQSIQIRRWRLKRR